MKQTTNYWIIFTGKVPQYDTFVKVIQNRIGHIVKTYTDDNEFRGLKNRLKRIMATHKEIYENDILSLQAKADLHYQNFVYISAEMPPRFTDDYLHNCVKSMETAGKAFVVLKL